MSSVDDGLRESMAAHREGRLDAAEAGYRRVLEARPFDPKALYYLGLVQFHRGDTPRAIESLRGCLARAPSNGRAWITLGGVLMAAGKREEATEAYRRATLAAPGLGEAWYNFGVCLSESGNTDGAVAQLRAGIGHQPDYYASYDALATLLYRSGNLQEAADVYLQWAIAQPSNPRALHMAAAATQSNIPQRASDDFVRELFDASAHSFDADLGRLGYRAHVAVASALARETGDTLVPAVLDAGCGTGLCGPLLRPMAVHLTGIDLSPRMLEQARSRNCYDELIVGELSDFMRSRPDAFDSIISADTLVYFGALEEPLQAAHTALRPGGALIFTLESQVAVEPRDYRLELHGRYAHNEIYIARSLAAAGFDLKSLSRVTLREERDLEVRGYLVVAGRQ